MPNNHTITTYSFDELSPEAQEKALEKYYDWNVQDTFWQECVIDDSKEIGKILGIEIENIYFSGFSSQGDGACFEGNYYYAKQAVKRIKEYAPQDIKIHEIAQELQDLQKRNFYALSANVKHSGHYYHEYCTVIDVDFTNPASGNSYYADSASAEALRDILRDFMRWIYRQLENEYEYQTSNESVKDSFIANETEFRKDGTIYH